MRQVMREGHTEPRVRLANVAADQTAYAVGALAGLEGEVTIADGEVWVARVDSSGQLATTGPFAFPDDHATLLTVTHVQDWESDTIATAANGPALEAMIETIAGQRGLDTTKPFPFLIEGKGLTIELHVVNGYCPMGTDPTRMDAKPWQWSGEHPGNARIVGFFAPDAAGVLTHHGTSIHSHALLTIDGRIVTGHVEHLSVPAGAILKTPRRR